jgi:quinol monooxygenase YgiN
MAAHLDQEDRRTMSTELQGIARCKFHAGGLEEFKRLAAQGMEIVRNKDTGTLQFDISFNDDESECIILERYRDSQAVIEHAQNFGDLNEAIIRTGSFSGELIGAPSAELKAMMASIGVQVFTPFESL